MVCLENSGELAEMLLEPARESSREPKPKSNSNTWLHNGTGRRSIHKPLSANSLRGYTPSRGEENGLHFNLGLRFVSWIASQACLSPKSFRVSRKIVLLALFFTSVKNKA